MNKKLLLSSLIIMAALATSSVCFAADDATKETAKSINIEQNVLPKEKMMIPPPDFTGAPPEFKHHKGKHEFHHPPMPSKEEMAAKKAEIEKRLNLTEKQKKQIEQNKEKDRAKIKPVMEKIKAKHQELYKIYTDESLTKEQKKKKAEPVKKELGKLKAEADKQRKQNMKNFESILTKEQKNEFEKIKQEQKAEMEKRKAEFEKKMKECKGKPDCFPKHPKCGEKMPVKPLPIPPEKK